MTYDPGRDAAERYPDWVIRHFPLRGVPEVLCRRRKVILIERNMGVGERRVALAHAVAHLDLEHDTVFNAVFETREENAADDLAASRLLPYETLAYWAPRTRCIAEIADETQVTEWFVEHAWERLTDDEQDRIRALIHDRDQGAA